MRELFPFSHIEDWVREPEPLLDRIEYRAPENTGAYVDLRRYEDDVTVLSNPHKGWFWHYVDNGFSRPAYRAEHDPQDALEDFPGLNHLYLRFDWGDIEKEEGKPDWSPIDQIIETWAPRGYRFSLRICAFEGDPAIPFATPEYVYRAGARGYRLASGCVEPDYGDPVFLEKLEGFLALAGEKFDGDPRIEMIDIGTYGTWGEGHTSYGSDIVHPAKVIRRHIDLHTRYFPRTPILLNDDHVNAGWRERSEEDSLALIRYARAMGLGLQDDSVCVRPYALRNNYTTLRTPWLFDLFWENAPIVLEFEHYHMVSPEIFKQGFPFLEAMRRTHCTFAGFHGYPRPWLQREPWFTAYCANRLGYWYFISGYELPCVWNDANCALRLRVENRGFGLCYRPYSLRVRLRGENGHIFETALDAGNTAWRPGETFDNIYRFRPTGLAPGTYRLYVGLFDGEKAIAFGYAPERQEEGYCFLGLVDVPAY